MAGLWNMLGRLGFSLIRSAGEGALEGVKRRLTGEEAADLQAAQEALASAETEQKRIEAEKTIERIKAAAKLREYSSKANWSPMSIGQYLIVVPFGLWWASIFVVSIVNENTPWDLVVQDVPPRIMDMSVWLIPLIVAGKFLESKMPR